MGKTMKRLLFSEESPTLLKTKKMINQIMKYIYQSRNNLQGINVNKKESKDKCLSKVLK